METRLENLGEMIGRLAAIEADEAISHEDVQVWSAPSECHQDVHRSSEQRRKEFLDSICFTEKDLRDACEHVGCSFDRVFEEAVARIYVRENLFI